MSEQKSDRRKQAGSASNPFDPLLYLMVERPTRDIWSIFTVMGGAFVNLVPICTSEQKILDLLDNLQDKAYQYAEAFLSKLPVLFEDLDVRFILDPRFEIKGGVLLFKEIPNWGITTDQLSSLLATSVKKNERK